MKVRVNKDSCIGCGVCEGIDEELFKIGDDGLSKEVNEVITEGKKENAKEAIDSCPTNAIEEISE